MPHPSFRAYSSTSYTTIGTTIAIPYPTLQAGDLLIAVFATRTTASLTTPSGWTSLGTLSQATTLRMSMFSKRATGSESGSLSITWAGSAFRAGIMISIDGASLPAQVLAASPLVTTGSTWTAPTINLTSDWMLGVVATVNNDQTLPLVGIDQFADWTLVASAGGANIDLRLEVMTRDHVGTGTSPTLSGTGTTPGYTGVIQAAAFPRRVDADDADSLAAVLSKTKDVSRLPANALSIGSGAGGTTRRLIRRPSL